MDILFVPPPSGSRLEDTSLGADAHDGHLNPHPVSATADSTADDSRRTARCSRASGKAGRGGCEKKKRVLTEARREQNKQAQRAYRQRQKGLRAEKAIENETTNVSSRRLLPKDDITSSDCPPGAIIASLQDEFMAQSQEPSTYHITPLTNDDDYVWPLNDFGALEKLFQSIASHYPESVSAPSALSPLPAPSSSSPSSSSASSSLSPTSSSLVSPHSQALAPSKDRQPLSSQSSPPGLQDEASTYADPYVNTLQFLPTTIFSACLHNARALGFDLFRLATCGMDYLSPYYCPHAKRGDDPEKLLVDKMKRWRRTIGGPQHGLGGAGGRNDDNHNNNDDDDDDDRRPQYNPPSQLPENLKPTAAQVLIPHHASLDLIPIPSFREQAIMLSAAMPHLFNLYELKMDIYVRGGLVPWKDDGYRKPDQSSYQGAESSASSPSPSSSSPKVVAEADMDLLGLDEYGTITYEVTGKRKRRVCEPWDERSWEAAPWFLDKWKMVSTKEMGRRSEWWRIVRENKMALGVRV